MVYGLDSLDPVLHMLEIPLDDLSNFPSEMSQPNPISKLANPDDTAIAVNLAPPGTISWFIQYRLQYAIDKIRAAPHQMVLENQTPWCHPCLYEHNMPRSMQGIPSLTPLARVAYG